MARVGLMGFSRLIYRVPCSFGSSNELCRQVASLTVGSSTRQPSGHSRLTSSYVQQGRRCTSTLQRSQQMGKLDELHSGSDISTGITEAIDTQLKGGSAGRLFAVVHVAGKQRKITTEDIIVLDKPIEADIGERIRLNKVLLVGGQDFTIVGRPVLSASMVRVEATVIEKTLSHTKIMFWYYKRQNHRVFRLRKDSLTVLRINDIDIAALNQS